RPQPPATQQRSQPPAMQQRPQPPATQQRAQPPATQQRPQPPATQQRPAYPPAPKKPLDIRMSVADEPPRTDLSPATPPAPPMTTEKHSRPKYFDVSFEEVHEGIEKKEPEFDTGPEDFKMKFDFDSAYRDVPEERPLRVRREKRTGCLGGMLYSAFVICVSLVLASLAWLAASDVLGFNAPYEAVTMTVPKEFSIDDVVDSLFDAGLIKYKFLFKIYANFSHAEDKITAGSYILYKNFDYRALVYGMTKWEGELVETTVTLPEGFTLSDIFTRLEDHRVCTAAELWEAAANYDFKYSFLNKSTLGDPHRLEGYLFPDTYNFFLDSSPESVINKLLGEFNRRFTETYIERTADMGYSIKDIITIASMIEREAGSDEERPRIAAVIYNRLEHPEDYPFLQIDATYVYAALGTGRLPTVDIDSPYNTYLHEGLPPGPISNPGIESIRAALYPDSTDEYFYALNREGTHAFFKTQAQHEAFVASDDYGGR
ncbi:MAG: endolytic transglycosylase MltG, partial [Oscillospiraceae bacterium]|nr:endolytic transglycosylase MltG [Oscillospiraceae bacterium]